jgi:hypothetical protein
LTVTAGLTPLDAFRLLHSPTTTPSSQRLGASHVAHAFVRRHTESLSTLFAG